MPRYERYGDDHEVAETVHTVEGSREDVRLSNSKAWKLVDDASADGGSTAPAAPAAAPAPKRAAKPAQEG